MKEYGIHGRKEFVWHRTPGFGYAEIIAHDNQEGKFIRDYIRVESDYKWEGNPGHAGCLDEMFAALKEGRQAETDCLDNINSISMVLGALESVRTGKKLILRIISGMDNSLSVIVPTLIVGLILNLYCTLKLDAMHT